MKKRLLILLLIPLFSSCGSRDETSSASYTENYEDGETPPLAVEAIEVTTDKLVPYLELSGTVEGVNEVKIVSQTQGVIEEVPVRLGQKVQKGDVLVKVDDSLARLNLRAAEEQAATARIDFDALSQSLNQGGSSRRELSAARNRLASAQAALEAAEQALEHCTLRSPITGTLSSLDRSISPGNRLSLGLAVARIIDSSSWVLESSLGERQIVLISEGSPVEIQVPSAGGGLESGRITAVSPGGDPATGSFPLQVEWTSSNPRIRSGMTASVRIPTEGQDSALIIPASSVVVRDRQDYVFIEEEGRAKAIPVERGDTLGNRLEIRQGLSGGELLIVSGLNSLAPDRQVDVNLVDRGEVLE